MRGDIPRAIVARLAWDAGTPVPADDLIADLWAEPPETVLSSLRAHISRLRGSGFGEVLGSGRGGYTLDVDPADVDVLRFRELVDAALREDDDARAFETLGEAEVVWSGDPFAGLGEFPFTASAVQELERWRVPGMERLAELRLGRREEAKVVLTMTDLAQDRPFDEGPVALLARALARSGRTSDALEAIDKYAARLAAADRGDLPRRLAELRQGIVRQDPAIVSVAGAQEGTVTRNGIPIPLTRLVGREAELELIARGRSESRLLTLVGPAGVGKTRLAIESARRTPATVDDVQWLVDLSAIAEPEDVARALASAVSAPSHDFDAVAARISGRRGLLLVDNAEHLIGAVAALVAELLSRCEGLGVIVTSREALRTAGERVISVEPFAGATAGDAVELFLQRAADMGAASWTDEERDLIADLCRRLEGIPLAIELAAARLDVLSLEEVAASLEEGSTDSGLRRRGRHASLENAIAWSTRLLDTRELELLSQLALFPASFSLDAVADICLVEGGGERELAVGLVRKSLVSVQANDTGVRRFRLLDSVRRFVRNRHPVADPEAWHARHLQGTRRFVHRQGREVRSTGYKRARAALHSVRGDILLAQRTATRLGDRAAAMQIAAGSAWWLFERTSFADCIQVVEAARAIPGEASAEDETIALYACVCACYLGGDRRGAIRYSLEMAAMVEKVEDPSLRALARVGDVQRAARSGDAAAADEILAELDGVMDSVRGWGRHDVLVNRGDALNALGRPAQALAVLSQAHRESEAAGDVYGVKSAAYVTGKVLLGLRKPREAIQVLRLRLARSIETEDWVSALSAIAVIACAGHLLDRSELGAELFAGVEEIGKRFGYAPVHEEFFPVYRERLREALTAPEWEEARGRGAALSFRDLVRRAQSF
ncbi:BTAD domain-containing putative transcriptional regulator [Naasia sp. SYSU D00948]|uniref:BTAD domain-containing putative transcriptional regulator n=1 Tax=Naasia sp. SYSU D00948 TaxID=2817379 RepID=UPI001B30EFC9|nr:BTAD domain-containing putative transcriptional regulator [Naasia sp. SYSU D00948]